VDFDPSRVLVAVIKVWAIFPGIPLVFWNLESLKAIGYKLDFFARMELDWDSKID